MHLIIVQYLCVPSIVQQLGVQPRGQRHVIIPGSPQVIIGPLQGGRVQEFLYMWCTCSHIPYINEMKNTMEIIFNDDNGPVHLTYPFLECRLHQKISRFSLIAIPQRIGESRARLSNSLQSSPSASSDRHQAND